MTGCAGLSLGVVHNREIVTTDNFGYADVEAKTEATSETVYGIGSLTKGIVAGAIASLVAQDKLSYDTPVKEILSSFSHHNKQLENELTVRDLLSHRSGLSDAVPLGMAFQGDGEMLLDEDQLFPAFADLRQIAPIRSSWKYTVWGYAVIGRIIAKLSGQSLHEYLQSSIFGPLGMDSTTLRVSGLEDSSKLARPYGMFDTDSLSPPFALPFALPHRHQFEGTFFEASGGVYSNVDDMLKWALEMLAQLHEVNGRLAPQSQLPSMADTTSNHVPVENPSVRESSYGMGWVRAQLPNFVGLIGDARDVWKRKDQNPRFSTGPESRLLIYHQGATAGYYSCLFLFPETGSAVVVLTNSMAIGDAADWIARYYAEALFQKKWPGPADYQMLAQDFREAHLRKYADLHRRIDAGRRPDTRPEDLSVYTGRFHHAKLRFLIEILGNPHDSRELLVRFQGRELQTYRLRHYHQNVFEWSLTRDEVVKRGRLHCWDPSFFQIRFEADATGRFSKLLWNIDSDAPAPEAFVRADTCAGASTSAPVNPKLGSD